MGSWRYLPGYVTYGVTAYITWNATGHIALVGGLTYSGMNIKYSYNDVVCWKYTGTTIDDNSQLWSGSGTVSDIVSKPYQ